MMQGIKLHAEGRPVSRLSDVAQVVLWTITFGLFVVSAALVFPRRAWLGSLGVFLATGVLFQVQTFVQPAPLVGMFLVITLGALLGPTRSLRVGRLATWARGRNSGSDHPISGCRGGVAPPRGVRRALRAAREEP